MSKYLPYTAEVGIFTDAALAEAQRAQLSEKGYYTFIYSIGGRHRVCVGRFGTEAEAQKTADDLVKKGFGGAVTTI